MENKVYTFHLTLNWELINKISEIDKFGGSWGAIEKREKQSLKELKSIATVRSVGASTRIEGSKITDDEVAVLIKDINVSKLEERDQQEVAGYYEALDTITEHFRDMDITENTIKQLHNILMRYSDKDEWHKGNYKQHSNVVEANNPDGTKRVVFQTTNPGFETEDAMRHLVEWYNMDTNTHPMIRSALFVYDFLSIHPFQDGNGRLSRLLASLLLLKQGYSWIQYVSFEHEIENRKGEYYKVLMQCQQQRPDEDVQVWVMFFLECLNNIQGHLMNKLEVQGSTATMSVREKKVYIFIENNPGSQSGEMAERLDIPLPTVKRMLTDMLRRKLIEKSGIGKGTNYTIGNATPVVASEEEEIDLDKQLMLLEEELSIIDPNEEIKWHLNDDTFYKILDSWLSKLLLELIPVAQKFNKLFNNPNHSIYTINIGIGANVKFIDEDPKHVVAKFIQDCRSNKMDIRDNSKVELSLRYGTFRKGGLKTFGCNFHSTFEFDSIKYRVLIDEFTEGAQRNSVLKYERLLHKPVTTKEIAGLTDGLGRALFKHIDYNSKKNGLR
jgi:Fic family protein